MRSLSPLILTVGLLVGMMSQALCDNYLKNADFKEGSQCWRGDGRAVFLKPDGTEGEETDPGVVPVIRVTLSKAQRRAVYQEFEMKEAPSKLHFKVQVYASVDFKRSPHASDYVSDDYASTTNADFAIRFMPDYYEHTSDLKPGEWVTVQDVLSSPMTADIHSIIFLLPPGDGVVYIKNPSLTP